MFTGEMMMLTEPDDDAHRELVMMKEIGFKGSKRVCGMTNGSPEHNERWWWMSQSRVETRARIHG